MPGKTTATKKTAARPQQKATAPNGKATTSLTNGHTNGPVSAKIAPITQPTPAPEPEFTQEELNEMETDRAALEGETNYAEGQPGVGVAEGTDVFQLSTDELEDPRAPKPDALRARILEVDQFTSEQTGSVAVVVKMFCDDLNKDINWRVFVPAQFVENIFVSPKDLPSEDGNNKAAQYAMGIHNRTNKATIDKFLTIAKSQGRSPAGLGVPENFDDYVVNLNTLLGEQGDESVKVVLLRRPNNDTGFLEIRDVLEPELIESKPAIFRNYRKSWETGENA